MNAAHTASAYQRSGPAMSVTHAAPHLEPPNMRRAISFGKIIRNALTGTDTRPSTPEARLNATAVSR